MSHGICSRARPKLTKWRIAAIASLVQLCLRIRAIPMQHGLDHRDRLAGHVIAGIGKECEQKYGHLVAETNLEFN